MTKTMTEAQIRKALKAQGWAKVRCNRDGEWAGIRYHDVDRAARGHWLFLGWNNRDVVKLNHLDT